MSVLVHPQYQTHCDEMRAAPAPPDYFCVRPNRYNYAAKVPRPSSFPAESSLYHELPEELLGPERLINHDHWVTQTGSVHDNKFCREERDFQPKHPKAPSSSLVQLVRPDLHRKVQGISSRNMKAYNPFPNRVSETKSNFTPRYPEASMFGQAGIFITDHIVGLPINRVNVRPAFYDDMFSVLRKAHPYMTTYRIYHKNFEDELPYHPFLDSLYNASSSGNSAKAMQEYDCAVKLRVRPMLDPFEQTVVKAGILPNLDLKRKLPGGTRDFAHLKQYFRRPPYSGCPPRVHQPVPHVGFGTSYKDHYDRPLHPNMALNFHRDDKFCFVQPSLSALGLMKTPAMYKSENNIYGSGRNVSRYVDADRHDPMVKAVEIRDENYRSPGESRQMRGSQCRGGVGGSGGSGGC